jgi:hypothetical protein
VIRRERGAANDNYSRVPAPVADAVKGAYVAARMVNAASRPLPDFLLAGAQRCGTTSLYRYLTAHPLVLPARPSKGVHHFDVHPGRSARWYRAHFPTVAARRRAGEGAITGEASPYYLFHPRAAERAAAVVPGARIIVMLRDPVERAYSHYRQEYARGFEDAETFERALELEPRRLQGERERMLADPAYESHALQHHSYAARGEYAGQLETWLAHFPPEQLLVVHSEAFFADPATSHGAVLRFLGLPDPPAPPPFKAYNARPAAGMDAGTRERLAAHFAEPNRRLEQLLGRAFGWTAPTAAVAP